MELARLTLLFPEKRLEEDLEHRSPYVFARPKESTKMWKRLMSRAGLQDDPTTLQKCAMAAWVGRADAWDKGDFILRGTRVHPFSPRWHTLDRCCDRFYLVVLPFDELFLRQGNTRA